jgi:hypothetical protein
MRRAPHGYARGNATSAAIILERPELYGPGLAEWARRWVSSHPPKVRRWQHAAVVASVGIAQDGAQLRLGFDGVSGPEPRPGGSF